jgi:hypothetical protein
MHCSGTADIIIANNNHWFSGCARFIWAKGESEAMPAPDFGVPHMHAKMATVPVWVLWW